MITCGTCGEDNPEQARFCWNCGGALAPLTEGAPREVRKTVTVVFADITDSTGLGERLDPEAMRALLARYFAAMREVLERHGGTVEKFIGDAVMAVFGVPTLHEDDALRAVRAAADMRERLATLNAASLGTSLQMRIGVNTGEIVAGSDAGELLVTGDAVNVAARLEQAAAPGEIVIGAATERLVREAVTAEPLEPLILKGKSDPVHAFRLVEVSASHATRPDHFDAPLVGRHRELHLIREALERASAEGAVHLFTVLGAAGIGKSRLVHEVLDGLGERATVLRGRCLPYGEGITYWPIGEVVRSAAGITDADSRQAASAKLTARLQGATRADEIADHVAAAIGLSDATPPREQIFWAIRRLLEHLAAERSVVIVLDDLQWAEPTLVELIAHLVEWSGDIPMLLVCMARPDLFERHPTWGGGLANATILRLEPLTPGESTQLIGSLPGTEALPEALRERVATAAEGNPLFVEEFVAMVRDAGWLGGTAGDPGAHDDLAALTVPPTVRALVSARLDRLAPPAQDVIGCAAVVGKVFEEVAVRELTPEPAQADVPVQLRVLVQRELVRLDSAAVDEDTYRFRHLVVRDAAYGALPKERRAELHERLATWLEGTAGDRLAELEEVIAHHLEAAHRYRLELGPEDETARAVAERALGHLVTAAIHARDRNDAPAAGNLFSRAVDLAPPGDHRRAVWMLDVAIGAEEDLDLDRGERSWTRMREEAEAAGAQDLASVADLRLLVLRASRDPTFAHADLDMAIAGAGRVAQEAHDPLARAMYWVTRSAASNWRGQMEDAMAHAERAAAAAAEAQHPILKRQSLVNVASALLVGPTPSNEVMVRIEQFHRETGPVGPLLLGQPLAQLGRIEEARRELAAGRAAAEELGLATAVQASDSIEGSVELTVGNLTAAERQLRTDMGRLEAAGETGAFSTVAGQLAWVLARLRQTDEAAEVAARARLATAPDDLLSQGLWRMAMALIAAVRGGTGEAERLAREAAEFLRRTDMLDFRGDAHRTIADVLDVAGRHDEATAERREALRLYEAKGVVPKIAELRTQLG